MAFDAGQNLDLAGRQNLRTQAANSGVWAYVEPINLTPSWVHFDNRWVQAGYPIIRQGSRGNYVLIAQDALTTLGYDTGGLDGIFGSKTRSSVVGYQNSRGLSPDGIIGPNTWRSLMADVVGKGPTNTTIN